MYFRYGHCDKLLVKLGDKVKKGQQIGTVGTGNNQYSAHLHFDILKYKPGSWTGYVFGWTLDEVKEKYADPGPYRKIVFPKFHHFGWLWLDRADYSGKKCYHPGEDLNGVGSGNADVGVPVYSACDGTVVYCYAGKEKNAGWGKLIVIEEETEEPTRIIDLSHHNTVKDWNKLKNDFIIHKCTQGTDFLDSTYKERKEKIQGSYHFAGKGFLDEKGKLYFVAQDPVKEADWYLKNCNENFLCLDWEIDHEDPVGWCKAFISRVKEKTGKDCWFYTNDARARNYSFPKEWKKWIARYADYTGIYYPDFTPKSNWDMHQYTSRGKVDGIEGDVDLSVAKDFATLQSLSSPKIDPGATEAPKVVQEPQQDEIVPIPVTVTTTLNPTTAPDNSTANPVCEEYKFVADPYPIAEKGIPYEIEKHWLIKLLNNLKTMENKPIPFYKSKTLWIAVAQGIVGVLIVLESQYPTTGALLIAKTFLDIAIRYITTQPIDTTK